MDARQPSAWARERSAGPIAPSQVIALGLVAVSIGWAVWLLRDRPTHEEVELLAGMALPSSEMALMEAAFDRAQLTDHRTEGGRVWVPRSRQSAYMRALVDAEALPREFGGSLRRALEKNSPWQSRAVQDELLRVATQEELALVICSMPGIERAAVLYDAESHHSLEGGGPAKTASVNVRTQPETELDPTRVQAIRVLVSASIAGLAPERVAVTDLRSGRVYAGPLDPEADRQSQAIAAADPTLARKIAYENHLAAKVRQAIGFVRGATVDVSVDFAPPEPAAASMASRAPAPEPVPPPGAALETLPQKLADANTPAEVRPRSAIVVAAPPAPPVAPAPTAARSSTTDGPDAIFVSIAVPDTYFHLAWRSAVERFGDSAADRGAIEAQESQRIRDHVESLLPATRVPEERRVHVTCFPTAAAGSARRETAGTSPAPVPVNREPGEPPTAADKTKPTDLFTALAEGRLDGVPRQTWLAAASVCVGLLAGFLWWAGGRREEAVAPRWQRHDRQQPLIDWSGVGDAAENPSPAAVSPAGVGRAAAFLLALMAAAPAAAAEHAADVRRTVASEPLAPEPFPLDAAAQSPPSRPAVAPDAIATTRAQRPAMPLSPVGAAQPLPAVPLSAEASRSGDSLAAGTASGRLSDWKLLAVFAGAFIAVAAARFVSRRRPIPVPPDVFEVLGEGSLGGQHAVRIVRFGPKTLLVGVSAAGSHTLAELSDPQATACIAAACRGLRPPLRPGRAVPAVAGPQQGRSAPSPSRGEAA